MAEGYHEPFESLSEDVQNVHRALATVIEELQAVDWYHQRADRTTDAELKEVILHNRNEEIEHATMALEWLRRNMPEVDTPFRTYLFTTKPITLIEEQEEAAGALKNAGQARMGMGVALDLGIGHASSLGGRE
jgi:ferritin-like protein